MSTLRMIGLMAGALAAAPLGGCALSDEAPGADAGPRTTGDGSTTPPDSGQPPDCQVPTASPVDRSAPVAVIVTRQVLRDSFQFLADLHTLTGISTGVVTIEEICAGSGACNDADPRADTAKAVKTFLASQPGLRYVILGGDIDDVPSRTVHDTYSNTLAGVDFEADFYSDHYFADLSEWDVNGDGVYAQDGVDAPDLMPELAVARIPASTSQEVTGYLLKVLSNLTSYPLGDVGRAIFFSNIAGNYFGVDVDSSEYLETSGRTLSLMPQGTSVRKIYASSSVGNPDELYTASAAVAAIDQGATLVVHAGHASPQDLMTEADGSESFGDPEVRQLTNGTYPIFLSSGCQAGAFGDPEFPTTRLDTPGENIVMRPSAGAIAYLGNTAVGLGLAGGMQYIDEMLRYLQGHANALLGEVFFAGHQNLPTSDDFKARLLPFSVNVMNQDSYEWTQKAVVLLGDPLVPVWTVAPLPAPGLQVEGAANCDATRFTFRSEPAVAGTLRFLAGGELYEVQMDGEVVVDVAGAVDRVSAGLVCAGRMSAYTEASVSR